MSRQTRLAWIFRDPAAVISEEMLRIDAPDLFSGGLTAPQDLHALGGDDRATLNERARLYTKAAVPAC